jgi:MFS family permease
MITKTLSEGKTPGTILGLPSSLWCLSVAAFFLNVSSVIAFAITPIFMMQRFGSTDLQAGILEGTVEGLALIVRSVTGIFSDFIGRRKLFLMWGYGISAVSRFLLAPSTLIEQVIIGRIFEKVGNGLQASPREAFISDVSPPSMIGRAYSLNKTWSMGGSLAGGVLIMYLSKGNASFDVTTLLWISGYCALLSAFILFFGIKDPKIEKIKTRSSSLREEWGLVFSEIKQFSTTFWATIGIICLFKLGLFSGTHLMARFRDSGACFFGEELKTNRILSNAVFQLFQCLACTLFSYPLGILSDRIDRRVVISIGFLCMIAALAIFSQGSSPEYMYYGTIFYGLQYAVHGSLMGWLSTKMPSHLYGTGFGIFFFTSGLSIVFSNVVIVAPIISHYDRMEPAFICIAVIISIAFLLIPLIPKTVKN